MAFFRKATSATVVTPALFATFSGVEVRGGGGGWGGGGGGDVVAHFEWGR